MEDEEGNGDDDDATATRRTPYNDDDDDDVNVYDGVPWQLPQRSQAVILGHAHVPGSHSLNPGYFWEKKINFLFIFFFW